MSVDSSTSYFAALGDGVTLSFGYGNAVQAATDLIVELQDNTTGTAVDQILNTDYTVTIAGDGQSAAILFVVAPPTGKTVVMRRNADYTQPDKLPASGPLANDAIEAAIDRVVMQLQAIRDTGNRGIRIAESDSPALAALPPLATLKGMYLYIDALGNPGATSGPAGTPVAAAMIPVVQGSTLAIALAAFGFSSFFQTLIGSASQAAIQTALGIGVSSAMRQTVTAGPVTTAGLPSFWPASVAGLTLTTQNLSSTYPLVATAANGWSTDGRPINVLGYTTSNLQWTATNGATVYAYATIGANGVMTPATTTLAPIYQQGGTPSTTSGQFTFNKSEMRGYMGNGTTAPQANIVFFGEIAASGGNITSPGTVMYAYNGQYESAFTATLPAVQTITNFSHNLGVAPLVAEIVLENTTTELGYAVGDQVTGHTGGVNSSYTTINTIRNSRNQSSLRTSINVAWTVMPFNNAAADAAGLTAANWKYKLVARRGW